MEKTVTLKNYIKIRICNEEAYKNVISYPQEYKNVKKVWISFPDCVVGTPTYWWTLEDIIDVHRHALEIIASVNLNKSPKERETIVVKIEELEDCLTDLKTLIEKKGIS